VRRVALPIAAALAAVLIVATAGAAGAAGAATIKLGWTEKLAKDASTRMTFRVGVLRTTASGWTATIEITNAGTGPVLVQQSQFGIVEYDSATNFTKPTRFLRATTLAPAPPKRLAPGKTWTGTIGGAGTPNDRLYVRLRLGPFATASSPTPFTWITDHARHVFTITI
jgi:hypothetical protein